MTDRSSKEVAAAAAETAIVSGSSAATAPLFKFWQQNLFHSRIPAILFDGNCRHASSHRRRWCLSSTCIQKQENDWSSHCQFIPVPVQTIETIEIFTGTCTEREYTVLTCVSAEGDATTASVTVPWPKPRLAKSTRVH